MEKHDLKQPDENSDCQPKKEAPESLIVSKDSFAIGKVLPEIHFCASSRKNWSCVCTVSWKDKFQCIYN